MPQLNLEQREITLKIVYYGPALSGKTTNLQQIHAQLPHHTRGEMVSLDTQNDRTLYFDFLPVEFGEGDFRIKLKLFTVPGQVVHRATRKVVLAGADAVAFIADSQRRAAAGNAFSYRDLESNLRANGVDFDRLPKVLQFNKRDLDDVKPLADIRESWAATGIPTIPAIAITGEGVQQTLTELLSALYRNLEQLHDFGRNFGITREDLILGVMRHFDSKPPNSSV
ncbi:MAG: hypothetical protein HRU00_02415 [Myxococcales bacterium]|nr:hypothetical protein [Myxococcales bacterium]